MNMTNQAIPVIGTDQLCIPFAPCSIFSFLSFFFFNLFKGKTHVCTLKMAEGRLNAYFASSHSVFSFM
jgi:hypothetical protein